MKLIQTIVKPYGSQKTSNWQQVEELIDVLPNKNGSIELEYLSEKEHEQGLWPYEDASIQVMADRGKYLITGLRLGKDLPDGEEILSYVHPSVLPKGSMVEILGDLWDPSMICYDLEVVLKAFKYFFSTGKYWMEYFQVD